MKILQTTILAFLLLGFCFSCDSNDDDGGGENSPVTFESTCCQVPHLEGCIGGVELYVPNAFTPNGDGFNDIFSPFAGQGMEEVNSFKVFKDNELVIERVNFLPNEGLIGWDGTLADGTIEDGIYAYTVTMTNVAGETQTFDGFVCLRSGTTPCVDFEKHCTYASQHDGLGGYDFNLPSFEDCQ